MGDVPFDLTNAPRKYIRSICALGWGAGSWGGVPATYSVIGAASWPVANAAAFWPFTLYGQETVYALSWVNGGAVTANVDAGIYAEDGTRLVSCGSTAQAGANAIQVVDVADTALSPDNYYFAFVMNTNAVGIVRTGGLTREGMNALGGKHMTGAFPLPSTATLTDYSLGTASAVPVLIAHTTPVF